MKRKNFICGLALAALAVAANAEPAVEAEPATNAVSAANGAAVTNAAPVAAKAPRPARITSDNTYYDRKEGVAIFSGHVHVDDERYQMHASKAYVFMSGTNDVERIVATGGVALTNETKRAYGARVTYYRGRGLVVLHSGDGRPAEVRDERDGGDQIVRGKKIRFWIDREQVEVLEADIQAPAQIGKETLPFR